MIIALYIIIIYFTKIVPPLPDSIYLGQIRKSPRWIFWVFVLVVLILPRVFDVHLTWNSGSERS
jgi:hypothetical protein